ncbi:MAG: energy transducer TonB, partial [Candidatus Eremiobacteraeota bacterium]|nr:energy transducer TonB [Candidatus Eremiobacteraeota bacterium]
MNLLLRVTGVVATAAIIGAGAAPAGAVLATDYVAPKLAQMGKSSVPISGSGVVLVKVLVKADGSFDVIKVFKSSNAGDNAAALDIARHSTYHVGLKGGKPTAAFYDFTLKFVGKSVSSNQGEGGGSGAGAIRDLLQSGKYAGAKAAATAYLANKPNDVLAQTYLGIADAFLNDDVGGAQAFDKLSSIPKKYQILAAQTYSLAAVQTVKTDPAQALLFAKKSLAIHPDGNAYFAMGVA